MKKLIHFLFAATLPVVALTQSLNAPLVQAGDYFSIAVGEPQDPGEAGANMVWDYTGLTALQNYNGQIVPSVPSTYQDDYPDASWIMELVGNQYYYNFGPEAFEYFGGVENGISYPYQDPELFYSYPFEFESTHSDESFNSLTIQGLAVERSTSTLSANDGHGTLNMPNEQVYEDVFRIRTHRVIEDSSITGLSTTEVVQTMFIQNGIAVPVITHTTLIITTTAGSDEYEFLEFMQSYAVEVGVVEPDLFAMYPNPSTERVTIKWENSVDVIEVYDGSGRLVESVSHYPGLNVTGIDVSDWNPGVYTVSLTSGEHVTTKKLVVE